MSLPSRSRTVPLPRPARSVRGACAVLAALAGVSACARFGFERLDLDADDDIGAGPGAAGGGGGEARGGAETSGGGPGATAGEGGAGGGAAGRRADGGQPEPGDAGPDGSIAVSCSDAVRNGDEVGVDCGGSACAACVCSFDAPQRLGDPNYPGNDLWSPRLSSNGLDLYFGVTVPGTGEQIAVATRPDRSSPFGLGQALPGPVNTGKEGTPHLSADGRSLYFYSERAGGAGLRDLYVATRSSGNGPFDSIAALTSLNGAQLDYLPWLDPDELTIHFASGPAGSGDIFRATRATRGDAFAAPELVAELSSSSDEGGITLSWDGREAIFSSNRPGGPGARDLYRATRARAGDPFSSPELLVELDTVDNEIDPALSPDGREIYFASNRDGGDSALYRAARRCTR